MKTKYVIPMSAIEDFRAGIDIAINAFKIIKKDLLLRNDNDIASSNQFFDLLSETDDLVLTARNVKIMSLSVIDNFIKILEELKKNVKNINTRKIECPKLFFLLGFMELKNPLSNAIVLKIMKDTINGGCLTKVEKLEELDIFKESLGLQKLLCGLLDGYFIQDNEGIIINAYLGFLNSASYVSKITVNGLITNPTVKDGMQILVNRVGLENIDSWNDFTSNYQDKYKAELTKIIAPPKEYKKGTTKMYTEINELEYYIKGGVVLHLCAPRTFDELLKRNNYSINARMSLGKQMKNALLMADDREFNALIGNYLASIDVRYQEMWNYLLEQDEVLKQVYLGDIRKYFYALPELGEGYGYTKEDFDYFMIDALKSNYYLAKKHSKALVLLKNGKINEKYGKTAKKFKKIN